MNSLLCSQETESSEFFTFAGEELSAKSCIRISFKCQSGISYTCVCLCVYTHQDLEDCVDSIIPC